MQRTVLVFCDDCPDRAACDTPVNRCGVVKMVHETCAAQGVPVKVTDPTVLRRIAVLLRG